MTYSLLKHLPHQVARSCDLGLSCHFKAGFVINLLKSTFVPSQVMLRLGTMIDTVMEARLPFACSDRDDNVCGPRVVQPHPDVGSTTLSHCACFISVLR